MITEITPLKSILSNAEIFNDGDWVESKDQDQTGDVRLIQLADIGDGKYLDRSNRFMTSIKAKALRCTFLKPGDLLIARMPDPLGRCCIFPGDEKPCVTVVDVCIVRPNTAELNARWLMHCLNAPQTRHLIQNFATGTTRKRISRSNLGNIGLNVPPLPEQKRIAEVLDRTEALRTRRQTSLVLLDEIVQSIFLDMFGDPGVNPHGFPVENFGGLIVDGPQNGLYKHSSDYGSGIGFRGASVRYGEYFAPDLRTLGSNEDVIKRMERATAQDYVSWAKNNDLEKWQPVSAHVRLYGISAFLCDMLSSGRILDLNDTGIAYVDYGPMILFGGHLQILDKIEAGELIGAIDVRSQSFFGRGTIAAEFDIFPWSSKKVTFTGLTELSASLKDQDQTWWAMGGYGMDGCRLKVFSFLELWGGMRVVPVQGSAVRAGGRAEGSLKFLGTGAGFSLAIDLYAAFGWNPLAIGGTVGVSGDVWFRIFGLKIGAGFSATLAVQLPMPLELRLDVEIRVNLPWPLKDMTCHGTIFSLKEDEVQEPSPPVQISSDTPLAYIHGPSGTPGQLTDRAKEVWPDIAFDLPFQRNASGPRMIVNPPVLAGIHNEAGIAVTHSIDKLTITKVDKQGNEVVVQGVSASWLLGRNGSSAQVTNRLAIPCNDPLGWCTTFDYAQPGSAIPADTFHLQTFGVGPSQNFPVDAGTGLATLVSERVRIDSSLSLQLLPVPWAGDYGRILNCSNRINIAVQDQSPKAGGLLPVKVYQLRIIDSVGIIPQFGVANGKIDSTTEVQRCDNGKVEWAVTITREKSDYRKELEIGVFEHGLQIAAVGFALDDLIDVNAGKNTVLAPGKYRLRLEGQSHASKKGKTKTKKWLPIVRDFQVVRPPLRPYLKFATFGDERVFGLSAPGWNPNPQGNGFGHYQDHLGLIRARVSYLSKIYKTLWISPNEDIDPLEVQIRPARDRTLEGSQSSQEWKILTGTTPSPEEELELSLPRAPGFATARIYFSVTGDGSDIDPDKPLDQWSYRVSNYPNSTAHVKPIHTSLTWAFGPSGAKLLKSVQAASIPTGFKFADSPPAQMKSGWALPANVAQLANIDDRRVSLGFLKILEWAGAFRMLGPAQENILNRPDKPEICLLRDRGASPVGLIFRVTEPCDWRRVRLSIVEGYATNTQFRFDARLAPSSDGCLCLALLEADGVPIRMPRGELAVYLQFNLASPDLPRLTHSNDLGKVSEDFAFSFVQPFGPAWSK